MSCWGVAFTDGRQARYGLVVGADGLHSNVRKLAFGPEREYVRHFGYYVALVDLPADRDWQRGMLNIPGLTIAVRDAGDGPQGMLLAASAEIAKEGAPIMVPATQQALDERNATFREYAASFAQTTY
jgi:hypothetical protein